MYSLVVFGRDDIDWFPGFQIISLQDFPWVTTTHTPPDVVYKVNKSSSSDGGGKCKKTSQREKLAVVVHRFQLLLVSWGRKHLQPVCRPKASRLRGSSNPSRKITDKTVLRCSAAAAKPGTLMVKTSRLWGRKQEEKAAAAAKYSLHQICGALRLDIEYTFPMLVSAQYVMGSSFPNLILLIASSGWINSSITQADMFKNHLKYKDTFWDFMCVFLPPPPSFSSFLGFFNCDSTRRTMKPGIERSVTLFSSLVVPIASQWHKGTDCWQQQTHKRRKKKSLPSSLEEEQQDGSLVVKDEVARYASGPVKEIIKWKVSKPAEYYKKRSWSTRKKSPTSKVRRLDYLDKSYFLMGRY